MNSQHGKNPVLPKPVTGKQEKENSENASNKAEGFEKLEQQGRFQNPNETNAPENVQEKVQHNEPGNLERKGAENNDHNQNRDEYPG